MTTDKNLTPITKHQSRIVNDNRAKSLYARRPEIDRLHDDMKLKRELREVYQ